MNTFATLVTWLGQPAETYLSDEEGGAPGAASLNAAVLPLLAGQKVTPEAKKAIADLVQAAYRLFKIVHGAGPTQAQPPVVRRRASNKAVGVSSARSMRFGWFASTGRPWRIWCRPRFGFSGSSIVELRSLLQSFALGQF